MKKILKNALYILLVAFMVSCSSKENLEETTKWINNADKPIIVILHTINGMNNDRTYSLIDSKGNIYNTGQITLTLPDTIIAH